jgi:hypothetical protein
MSIVWGTLGDSSCSIVWGSSIVWGTLDGFDNAMSATVAAQGEN